MHKAIMKNNRGHYRSQYDLQRDFKHIKEALADTTQDVTGRMAEILAHSAQDVKDKSLTAKEYAAEYISERPFKLLGVAVLAGIIIGFLFRK